jgi:hypothetical protein
MPTTCFARTAAGPASDVEHLVACADAGHIQQQPGRGLVAGKPGEAGGLAGELLDYDAHFKAGAAG